jgi:hypothetical protein
MSMRSFDRRRLALVGVGALAVVAAAAALALTRGGTASALAQGRPGVLARGEFRTVSWGTTGSATVERTRTGKVVLRLSRDFTTQRAPELFVHMAGRRMVLQRPWGEQVYVLKGATPALLRTTVEVFCEKCNKAWGRATLKPTVGKA